MEHACSQLKAKSCSWLSRLTKLIPNLVAEHWFCSTTTEQRLTASAVLNIKIELAKSIDLDNFVKILQNCLLFEMQQQLELQQLSLCGVLSCNLQFG
jgi:hypothetical protein